MFLDLIKPKKSDSDKRLRTLQEGIDRIEGQLQDSQIISGPLVLEGEGKPKPEADNLQSKIFAGRSCSELEQDLNRFLEETPGIRIQHTQMCSTQAALYITIIYSQLAQVPLNS